MTDGEKLSTLTRAAALQQQYDGLLRARDAAKAQMANYDQQMQFVKKQMDDLWNTLRINIGSGS